MINFYQKNQTPFLRRKKDIKVWLKQILHEESKELVQINIIYCDDEYLYSLNKDFLKHDYYTDIITFDYSEEDHLIAGELFISVDRVKENAKMYNASFDEEMLRVMAHGVLHLIGYNDTTDQEKGKIREKEDYYLALFERKEFCDTKGE